MKWIYQKNNGPMQGMDAHMNASVNNNEHRVIVASYLIPVWEGNILMARRFQTGFEDGKYSFVAGHVKQGESCRQCIVREAKEEIGITIRTNDLEMVHMMHRNAGLDNERVDVFFVTTRWQGEIINCEPHKCDDLGWYDFAALPPNTIPYVAYAVQKIIDDEIYSEYGYDSVV